MIRHLLTEQIPYSSLPLSAMSMRHLCVIEKALAAAWIAMKSSATGQKVIASGSEDEITIRLQQELNAMRNQRSGHKAIGFNKSFFGLVSRSSSFLSYDAKHLNKSPDLVIRLTALRKGTNSALEDYDAVFIECKPLSQVHPLSEYAVNGILRFTEGQYAWAMPHALMVAYVKNKNKLPDSLDALTKPKTGMVKRQHCTLAAATQCKVNPEVYTTDHSRSWKYPEGNSPGAIKLRHLWLRA